MFAPDTASGLMGLSLSHSNMHLFDLSLSLSPSRWMPFKIYLTTGNFALTAAWTVSTSAHVLKTVSLSVAKLSVVIVSLLADASVLSCEFKSEKSRTCKLQKRRVLAPVVQKL